MREESYGTIAKALFPTGIDRRDDLGLPERFDVYYGMEDNGIDTRFDLPGSLPSDSRASAVDSGVRVEG